MKQIDKLLSVVLLEAVFAAILWCFGYQLAASVLLALAALDIIYHIYKSADNNFTPKMKLMETVTKGGDFKYEVYIKRTLLGGWYFNNSHTNKEWCTETGQRELIRVLEAAIAKERAKVVTTTVVPIDTPPN